MTMIEVEPQPRIDTLVRLPGGGETGGHRRRRRDLHRRPVWHPDLDPDARQRPPRLAGRCRLPRRRADAAWRRAM